MKTTNNRRRFLRRGNGRRHPDEHANRDYPGEFAHRYSENIEGDQYLPDNWQRDEWEEEWSDWIDWDENPGDNINYNRPYGHTEGGEWMRDIYPRHEQEKARQGQHEFRGRNTRFRNRLRGYHNRMMDTNIDYDRDNLERERGSIDEHMNRRRRNRYDNW